MQFELKKYPTHLALCVLQKNWFVIIFHFQTFCHLSIILLRKMAVPPSIFPVLPQKFSFLAPLMSYIYTQRTSTLHSKLIQSCKYFFAKDPIVVVKNLEVDLGWICIYDNSYETKKYFDLEKMKCKLWINSTIFMVTKIELLVLYFASLSIM